VTSGNVDLSRSYIRTGVVEWKVSQYQTVEQPSESGPGWNFERVVVPAIVHPCPNVGEGVFIHTTRMDADGDFALFGMATLEHVEYVGDSTSMWLVRSGDFERQQI